ncbi:MAG: lasso peptide biosynthesis B2 protein [Bryobacteraceae bacterium]|nr:lasso peptide biosynthesis B2 protein [Bryobacteraceae bacterium]
MAISDFLRLSWRDRFLMGVSFLLLCAMNVALRLIPFRRLLRLVERVSPAPGEGEAPPNPSEAKRLALAVYSAARYVPGARCLAQALVLRMLLGWNGTPCRLQIGVAKPDVGRLDAHAWVESGGLVLLGGHDAPERYSPLPEL